MRDKNPESLIDSSDHQLHLNDVLSHPSASLDSRSQSSLETWTRPTVIVILSLVTGRGAPARRFNGKLGGLHSDFIAVNG